MPVYILLLFFHLGGLKHLKNVPHSRRTPDSLNSAGSLESLDVERDFRRLQIEPWADLHIKHPGGPGETDSGRILNTDCDTV